MPKDSKAFLFFMIFVIAIWRFGESLKSICIKNGAEALNNPIFSISYAENTGGAWSIFQNQTILFISVGIIVLLALIIYVYKNVSFEDKTELFSISVLSGGILGNFIERLNSGYVIDYIKLNFINFPIFNAFDMMICTGVFLFFLDAIINEKKNGRKNNKNRRK